MTENDYGMPINLISVLKHQVLINKSLEYRSSRRVFSIRYLINSVLVVTAINTALDSTITSTLLNQLPDTLSFTLIHWNVILAGSINACIILYIHTSMIVGPREHADIRIERARSTVIETLHSSGSMENETKQRFVQP